MLAHLRSEGVLIPTATVLERIGLAARVSARRRVFRALAEGLTDVAREAVEKLLTHRTAIPVCLAAGLCGIAGADQPARTARPP